MHPFVHVKSEPDKPAYIMATTGIASWTSAPTVGTSPGNENLDKLSLAMSSLPIPAETAGSDMLYSSGTIGRPKGVRRPFQSNTPIDQPTPAIGLAQRLYKFDGDTVYLSPAPLYHAGPLRWALVVQRLGGTVVIINKFYAEQALKIIDQCRVTDAQWGPTHLILMLRLPEETKEKYNISSLKTVFHAAAPCPVPVKEAMIDWWGPIIHEYYSSTKNNGLTMITP